MSNVCQRRLQREFVALQRSPVSHVTAVPNEENLLEWHYCIEGPPGSVYEGGFYWGVLRFSPEYPYKPPSILMFTKSGRFKPHTRLCLSMSDYHPEEWNPMWSVASILSGLLCFMLENTSTLGSIDASDAVRRVLAQNSLNENLKNAQFRKLFPDIVQRAKLGGGRGVAPAGVVSSSSAAAASASASAPAPVPQGGDPEPQHQHHAAADDHHNDVAAAAAAAAAADAPPPSVPAPVPPSALPSPPVAPPRATEEEPVPATPGGAARWTMVVPLAVAALLVALGGVLVQQHLSASPAASS